MTGTIFEGHKISIREWVLAGEDIPRSEGLLHQYSPSSGRVYLDETYYSVRFEDIKRTPDGAKLRGISTNQLCVGVACTDERILCIFEGNGRPSKRKTFQSSKDIIAPGSTLVHDRGRSVV